MSTCFCDRPAVYRLKMPYRVGGELIMKEYAACRSCYVSLAAEARSNGLGVIRRDL